MHLHCNHLNVQLYNNNYYYSFCKYNLSSFQFFVQNWRGEEDFEVEPPDFDIEYVGANVR